MKLKNINAMIQYSKTPTSNYSNSTYGSFICASGEILLWNNVSIVCVENYENESKKEIDLSENLHLVESSEKIPNVAKDFNAKNSIDEFCLEDDSVMIDLENLKTKIKQVHKIFGKRGKTYINSGHHILNEKYPSVTMQNATTEYFEMKNGETVFFNTEILHDIAKIICDRKIKVYFSGSKKPIYVVGKFGTAMFLPIHFDKTIGWLNGMMNEINIDRVVRKEFEF